MIHSFLWHQVPEFPRGLTWYNSPPLSISRDLKGKVLILDFWTYCCINCMHVLPELKLLEEEFAGEAFAVVGVHSAKFDNEKDDEAIRNAVIRYDVKHPVVNDRDMTMWRALGINSWPSLLVISPNGKVLGRFSGEGHYEELKGFIKSALSVYGQRNELNDSPLRQSLEKDKDQKVLDSTLRYPGKIILDKSKTQLFISDSGNHRIIVCKSDGSFIEQIGGFSGAGLTDGSFGDVCFHSPQGLAYDDESNVLYVADTENHALRAVNMGTKTVKTVVGDGSRGMDLKGGKKGTSQKLNSPWDLCMGDKCVYIAISGQHQIWSYDTRSGVASVLSGNGYERNNNTRNPSTTSWAQPSGLALLDGVLYVADSESSSIRSLDIATGEARSEAGGDPGFADNLFAFGDKDGVGSKVRLQHPLAVCASGNNTVYVADSYNHKIKALDTNTKSVRTVAGNGNAGYSDGPLNRCSLSEPAGIADRGDGILLIADTNNCIIRKVDLASDTISTLDTSSVPKLSEKGEATKNARELKEPAGSNVIDVDMANSGSGMVELVLTLPDGYHYTKGAKSSYTVRTEDDKVVFNQYGGDLTRSVEKIQLKYERNPGASQGKALVDCRIYYCKEESACAISLVTFKLKFPQAISSSPSSSSSSSFNVPVPNITYASI